MLEVLLVCDDTQEEARLSAPLQRAGIESATVLNIEGALALWETEPADLIVLVRDRDGLLAAVRQLRAVTIVPLLLITDELSEDEQVTLMDEGRAFLVTHPYSLRLLMSQIRLLLHLSAGVPRTILDELGRDAVVLLPNERAVRVGTQPARPLSKLEFSLLFVLMQHAGQVLSAEILMNRVWGYDEGDKRLLQNLVLRLRKKLEPNPRQPRYLLTERDVGYRFLGGVGRI